MLHVIAILGRVSRLNQIVVNRGASVTQGPIVLNCFWRFYSQSVRVLYFQERFFNQKGLIEEH